MGGWRAAAPCQRPPTGCCFFGAIVGSANAWFAIQRPSPTSSSFGHFLRRQYWAAGTGYGHSGVAGEKWDVEAYLAAQREQDRLKQDLIEVCKRATAAATALALVVVY